MADTTNQRLDALEARVEALEAALAAAGNAKRGPKTERPMEDADAFRAKFGDLKDKNHKEAAAELGLSYGQVFSARGGYTFKHVKADWKPKIAKPAEGGAA